MKSFLAKVIALLLAVTLGLASADPSATQAAGETAAEAKQSGKDFLKEVIGEYVPLFEGTTFNSEYDHYWHDYAAAVAGESMADTCVSMLKGSVGGKEYGDKAGENFFCGFTADVKTITFGGNDGSEVNFTLNSGKKITHTYSFVKETAMTGNIEGQEVAMGGYLYKSNDGNKDEFAYLFMAPDTPATTYHLELRYGDSEENILKLIDGKYKNWVASCLPSAALKDQQETGIQQVLALFVLENLESMTGEESVSQRASISGFWEMDTTAFKDYPGYENASMYIRLNESGKGKSFVDMTGSGSYLLASQYPFYTYGKKDSTGKETGVYIVVSDDEGVKTATYDLTEKDGKKVLTFYSSEGILTYYEREAAAPGSASVTKAVKNGKKLTLTWSAVNDADGYEILVSAKKNFKKAKTITVQDKTKVKVKNLKKSKYYVKLRAYNVDAAGNKVYSDYSKVITVKPEQTDAAGTNIACCLSEMGEYGKAADAWKRIVDELIDRGFTYEVDWPRQMMNDAKSKS